MDLIIEVPIKSEDTSFTDAKQFFDCPLLPSGEREERNRERGERMKGEGGGGGGGRGGED